MDPVMFTFYTIALFYCLFYDWYRLIVVLGMLYFKSMRNELLMSGTSLFNIVMIGLLGKNKLKNTFSMLVNSYYMGIVRILKLFGKMKFIYNFVIGTITIYFNYMLNNNNAHVYIDVDGYNITYYLGMKRYTIIYRTTKNSSILLATGYYPDDSGIEQLEEDITDEITSLAGPLENFHGIEYTPRMLKYDKIVIELENKELSFNENEIIRLN